LKKPEIMNRIANCTQCGQSSGTPFFFPMADQEVMLISAVPSLQALYKPLPSIRFFRNICFTLFGDKYLREKTQCEKLLLEFCDGNIYWTHYHKCFMPGMVDYTVVDDTCAQQYLLEEIRILKPKLIIVLGEPIQEKVHSLIGDYATHCLFKPFPNGRNAEEFADVREILARYLRHVKIGFAYNDSIRRYEDEDDMITRHETHLRFELSAFEKMMVGGGDISPVNISDIWHKSLVVPNMQRCAKLVSTYSFIENQIKVFLQDFFATNGQYTILRNFRQPSQMATLNNVMKDISDHWINGLEDYVRFRDCSLLKEANRIKKQLWQLREFRNAIVHYGGLLDNRIPKELTSEEPTLKGIYNFAGTVYVSPEGETVLKELAADVTELLCKIQ